MLLCMSYPQIKREKCRKMPKHELSSSFIWSLLSVLQVRVTIQLVFAY